MISTKEEIKNVATISANSDIEIGEIIASAMEKVLPVAAVASRCGCCTSRNFCCCKCRSCCAETGSPSESAAFNPADAGFGLGLLVADWARS